MGLTKLIVDERDEDPIALQDLIDRTFGFDINPVSVLMARVNVLLVLGDRAEHLAAIVPRIYEADSIMLPAKDYDQLSLGGSGRSRRIDTSVGDFFLPEAFASLPQLSALRENIEAGVRRGRDSATFRDRLSVDLLRLDLTGAELDEALDGASAIYSRIYELSREGKDGVWARIIEQALAPLYVKADVVVGNPPWVSWKNLPQNWKSASESLWRQWGLWQETGRTGGVPLSDISVLLAARALHTYAPNGITALLFPISIQIADPAGRPFRAGQLRPDKSIEQDRDAFMVQYAPLHVDDFSAIRPFSPDAQNEPIAIYLKSGVAPEFPVRGLRWHRAKRGSRLHSSSGWPDVRADLESTETALAPVHRNDFGSPWAPAAGGRSLPLLPPEEESHYNWGRGYETRGLDGYFFYEIISPTPVGPQGLVRVRNLPDLGSNTRGNPSRESLVEPRYLWPLVKGEQVQRWRIESKNLYCLVAHDVDLGSEIVSVRRMMNESPKLYDYLEPWLPAFRHRSLYRSAMDGDKPWGLSGPVHHLDPSAHIVLVRYIATGGRPQAAVARPNFDPRLGRRTVPLPNNKSNIYVTGEAEANYLAAWINSPSAQDAIGRFAAATGITPKALKTLPIPRFDATDKRHARISEIGREGHATNASAVTNLNLLLAELDELVQELAAER